MKKGLMIFIIVFLVSFGSGLWAQTTIYDTVVPETKYAYSFGLRYMYERSTFSLEEYGGPTTWGANYKDIYFLKYERYGFSLFGQVEWKHFILGIAPSYSFMKLDDRKPTSKEEDNQGLKTDNNKRIAKFDDTLDWDNFGVDIQLLFKLPLVDKNFKLFMYAGPEFAFNKGLSLNVMAGVDLGFKLTTHHALFISPSIGALMFDAKHGKGFASPAFYEFVDFADEFIGNGPPMKIQVSVGIRTFVLGNGYYYQGERTGRR